MESYSGCRRSAFGLFLVSILLSFPAGAVPCAPGTLTDYLAVDSCTIGAVTPARNFWTFSDFYLLAALGGTSYIDENGVVQDVDITTDAFIVRPFGGVTHAGLEFELVPPFDEVPYFGELGHWTWLEFSVQSSQTVIDTIRLEGEGLQAGVPPARATVIVQYCAGANFQEVVEPGDEPCVTEFGTVSIGAGDLNVGTERDLDIDDLLAPTNLVDTVMIANVLGDEIGGGNIFGGATMDRWRIRFNAPVPSSFALVALGLAGLGFARKRKA